MSIIVTRDGKAFRRLDASKLPQERFLQDYVVENPDALPFDEIDEKIRFLIVAKELQTDSGPLDALGIDQEGNPYIIETKLFRNPDKRRVIAQMLDYGASLWTRHADARSFRDRIEKAARDTFPEPLVDRIATAFDLDVDDAESLLVSAEEAVKEGRFRFVVLMDSLDDRLKDLITFLNENSTFAVYGVEMDFYQFDGYEVTIPRLFGAESRPPGISKRRTWKEESFFAHAASRLRPGELTALRQLHDYARGAADRMGWGTGGTEGSFNPRFLDLCSRSIITAYTDGRLVVNFGWMIDDAGNALRIRDEMAKHLSAVLEHELPDDYADKHITLNTAAWTGRATEIIAAIDSAVNAARTTHDTERETAE